MWLLGIQKLRQFSHTFAYLFTLTIMILFKFLLYATGSVYALPPLTNDSTTAATSSSNGSALPFIYPTGKVALPPNGSAKRSERGNMLYNKGPLKSCVYDDGYDSGQVSLLWGENEGFQRRLSRAINCVPPLSLFRPRSMGSAGQDSAWPWPDLQLV